jgi:hypothetical protein
MQSRPSKLRRDVEYPKLATYRLRHNVAHDMLRVVGWAASAKLEDYNKVFAAYTRPLIALVFAASAIEGYTNYVGQSIDPDWRKFSHGMLEGRKGRLGIRDKIERVYMKLDLSLDWNEPLFARIVQLFDVRGQLMHPSLDEREFTGKRPPADVTEMAEMAFSPEKRMRSPRSGEPESSLTVRLETSLGRFRMRRRSNRPNKAPEPTPTAVTPRAIE